MERTVSTFLPEYTEQVNIPICTGANVLILYCVEVIILYFGQGLWSSNHMVKFLINTNQSFKFGIKICDDPTDQHKNLGLRHMKIYLYSCESKYIPVVF